MSTVLVVDDESDIRELVRINLELDGHRVLLAADGPDALSKVQDDTPDLILLDVMMPGLDGWEVLGQLKADPRQALSQIPVLMLTARSDDMDRIRGGIEGAIHYITKPFSVAALRGEVSKALEGDPEPVKRRQAQHAALERLARLEKGDASDDATRAAAARPRLTRFESPTTPAPAAHSRPRPPAPGLSSLSSKQVELLSTVGSTPTVRQAAEELEVSRSNVYASLRRIARKLGVRSVPELVSLARQGAFAAD
ncbi:MAG: two-component system, OmpR family, alkaline phosphatase synthesis response regulator PhoP [Acidimicrobiaceae bacterium]|jgi:DNA-binding response OmpR family regulator/DNA-binding CsgD family transcriptional regulator|nr:two-component system, OmpR family, alkaline phosphatase synthesis response regulator PhoP [Acidimicrobiaceae bacterium]